MCRTFALGAAISLTLLLALSPLANAQDLGSCRFHLPRDAKTIVYGLYGAPHASNVAMAGETHRVRRAYLRVPKADRPVFIVLTAYDPVEWYLLIDEGADVAGALVMGYHNQAIRNLPSHVPHAFSIFRTGRGEDCPKPIYAYGRGNDFSRLKTLLGNEFSRTVDEAHFGGGRDCLYPKCLEALAEANPGFWSRLWGKSPPPKPVWPLRASAAVRSGAP
jgi:hypothetical protein